MYLCGCARMTPHALPFAADVYVLSYPKAGRTWLRALIGKVLVDAYGYPESRMLEVQAMTTEAGLPVVGFDHDGSAQRLNVRWQDLDRERCAYRGSRVLLLGRDPRDNLVSAYFQATRRIKIWMAPIAAFVRDDRFGVQKLLTFYQIWQDNQLIPDAFEFVRYEDLHRDTAGTLARILAFLGIDATPSAVERAVEHCRFENLRKAEAERRYPGRELAPGVAYDPESYKVRKGKVGNFIEYLSTDDIAYIDAAVAESNCAFAAACAEAQTLAVNAR